MKFLSAKNRNILFFKFRVSLKHKVNMKCKLLLASFTLLFGFSVNAQGLVGKLKQKASQAAEKALEKKAEEKTGSNYRKSKSSRANYRCRFLQSPHKTLNTENNKTDFTLQIPLNSTLLTLTVPDSNEVDVLKFANYTGATDF